MRTEIETAVAFWVDTLPYSISQQTRVSFQQVLSSLMATKFVNHWHTDFPERGQALREIACDLENNYVDPMLLEAAQLCGFSFTEAYTLSRGTRMWVDPGEVEVSFIAAPYHKKVLYQLQSRSYSPELVQQTPVSYSTSPVYYPNPTVYYDNCYYDQSFGPQYPVQHPVHAGM